MRTGKVLAQGMCATPYTLKRQDDEYRLNSILMDFARPVGEASESLTMGNFVPAVDIYEDEQKLVLKVEVAGIRQQDLDLRVENQTLTVRGRAQV